jgi:hypothetical protein
MRITWNRLAHPEGMETHPRADEAAVEHGDLSLRSEGCWEASLWSCDDSPLSYQGSPLSQRAIETQPRALEAHPG